MTAAWRSWYIQFKSKKPFSGWEMSLTRLSLSSLLYSGILWALIRRKSSCSEAGLWRSALRQCYKSFGSKLTTDGPFRAWIESCNYLGIPRDVITWSTKVATSTTSLAFVKITWLLICVTVMSEKLLCGVLCCDAYGGCIWGWSSGKGLLWKSCGVLWLILRFFWDREEAS